jgi:RNA polymerase sigma factor for flagellar operon FliA
MSAGARLEGAQAQDDGAGRHWHAFWAGRGELERNRLVVEYAPLVKFVAARLAAGMPSSVDHADLVSYGMFGLIDAIERFDPNRGVKFETYAVARIRGAIIDELRAMDWVPRSVRSRARRIELASASAEARLGRAPSDAELADELGIEEAELRAWLLQISRMGLVALDELLSESDRTRQTTIADLTAANQPDPPALYEVEEMRKALSGAVASLGERERRVVLLYYFEGLTLAQIGDVLGVSESRVCQIHTKAMLQLRSRLGGGGEGGGPRRGSREASEARRQTE